MVNREGFQRKIRWNKCRKALSGLMTVALFIGGFVYCDKLLTNKQSIQKYGQFFESDKTFDVLFVGSSHVVNGISPLDLFRDYGISSFNLAMHGNYVKSGYYLLKSTLERMERGGRDLPEMVVLDVYGDWEDIGNLHTAWDSFPFNQTKNEMARELTSQEDYMGMVMPFSLYHSR